jgi:predicted nucleic acid-binding Zn ribbon protein
MSESIPPHSHCQICGKATPVSETICSEECKQKYHNMIKKRKLIVYAMYALIAMIIILLIWQG